jgi:hypothetical protein
VPTSLKCPSLVLFSCRSFSRGVSLATVIIYTDAVHLLLLPWSTLKRPWKAIVFAGTVNLANGDWYLWRR